MKNEGSLTWCCGPSPGGRSELIRRRAHREAAAGDRDHIEPGGRTDWFSEYGRSIYFRGVPVSFLVDAGDLEADGLQRWFRH